MTAEFESMTVLLLVVLTIACLVQVVLVGLLFWTMKRVADSLVGMRSPAPPVPPPPPAPVPAPEAEAPKAAVSGEAGPAFVAVVPSVDILKESPDIQGSIQRLCEKYTLSDFIIATLDGLVVVSLYPGSSEEAARFSDLYRRKKKPDSPNVIFVEVDHRGEVMLGIAGADRTLTPGERKGIGEDARKILDWWL
ncbi:MAG: hypothetical protein LUQ32_02830 [Methanomicrobiales archaeon]|nr:hypothetical protein [Methanomicrobiales archaeon]